MSTETRNFKYRKLILSDPKWEFNEHTSNRTQVSQTERRLSALKDWEM